MSVNSPLDSSHNIVEKIRDIDRRLRVIEKGAAGPGSSGIIHIGEPEEPPNVPPTTSGGYLYVQGGALWFVGGGGTVTQIGPA